VIVRWLEGQSRQKVSLRDLLRELTPGLEYVAVRDTSRQWCPSMCARHGSVDLRLEDEVGIVERLTSITVQRYQRVTLGCDDDRRQESNRRNDDDVATDGSARSVRLEHDLQARTRCLCEALQRVGRRTHLPALDARDVDCDVFIRRASCTCDRPAAVRASINARARSNSSLSASYASW
jgi:hypothetical protein